ncbi:MAG: pyrroline-5-carboxylate reductase [Propionibacteriaceae bacterium]|jgi:pyrroline-5-carboxylate reductase|nr:pyrroline-5-carboxylate reductase [Propionibacteriaceae bacterium]
MTIAILGVGMMGEALVSGMIDAGWKPEEIRAVDTRQTQREAIRDKYGVFVSADIAETVEGVDTVLIAVKPQDLFEVIEEACPHMKPGCLIISVVAGVSSATIERHLVIDRPVVRVMPNTASLVGQGMSAMARGSNATKDHVAQAQTIMEAVGKVVVIPEKYMDAVTAISGSGTAYLMFVAESMIDAGVMLGLPRGVSTDLVKQTIFGAGSLLTQADEHPTVLKENVTSPGGTTAAALRVLEDRGVKAALIAAVEAAAKRSEEIGRSQAS